MTEKSASAEFSLGELLSLRVLGEHAAANPPSLPRLSFVGGLFRGVVAAGDTNSASSQETSCLHELSDP